MLNGVEHGEGEQHAGARLFVGERVFGFAAEETSPGLHLLGVAFGAERFFRLFASAINVHLEEIEKLDDHAGGEEGDGFFWIRGVALRAVDELATGAVGEFDLGGDAVREGELAGGGQVVCAETCTGSDSKTKHM